MTDIDHASDSFDDPDGEADAGRPRISELRLVIEAQDWDAAVRFYRDALGLPLHEGYANDEAAQLVLDAGRASIELVHPELPSSRSEREAPTELDSPPSPRLRLVFRSDDSRDTTQALEAAGAEMLETPHLTAIGSIKARVLGPDHMPVTVYQPLSGPDFAEVPSTAE